MISCYKEVGITTGKSFDVIDITGHIKTLVRESGVSQGMVTITSLHTACALAVNEYEARLFDDMREFFLSIAPPGEAYKHNDLHLRADIPPDEPENAHSHLIAMLLGNGEVLAVVDGEPVLGRYQSILLLETDGPRERRAAVQVIGIK